MNRTIYIKDEELWRQAQDKAASEGKSMSAVIEIGLRNYLNTFQDRDLTITKIRNLLETLR